MFTRSAFSDELTYEDLVRLIQTKHIHSIEQLLAQPELEKQRSKYVLMYRSQSQQPASFESPRAILFGEDAKLIISFNGDPKLWKPSDGQTDADNPFNKLEIIQYRDDSAKFDFYEIQFPPKDSSVVSEESKSTPASKVVFSPKNPDRCMGCHRGPEDPRPNWEHYPKWPGAYGGNDDFIHGREFEPNERAHLDDFIRSSYTHPRYAFLPSLKERYTLASNGVRVAGHNNNAFTEALGNLNFRRIARIIKSIPQYEDNKYLILSGISGCFGQDKHGPAAKKSPQRKFPFSDFISGISEPKTGPGWTREDNLRLIFGQWGISIDDWFMNFKKSAENQFTIPSSYEDVLVGLLADSDTQDLFNPRIATFNFPRAGPQMAPKDYLSICAQLRERHLARLAKMKSLQESKAPLLVRMKAFLKKMRVGASTSGQETTCEPSASSLTGLEHQISTLEEPARLILKKKPHRPEKLQSCVKCHTWMAPDNLEDQLNNKNSYGRTLKEEILYRISGEARKAGKGMPKDDQDALNAAEIKDVKTYLDSF